MIQQIEVFLNFFGLISNWKIWVEQRIRARSESEKREPGIKNTSQVSTRSFQLTAAPRVKQQHHQRRYFANEKLHDAFT